jgi:hypothetical protein
LEEQLDLLTAATEQYNGTSWTNTTSMGTARRGLGGAGSQTAAFAAGGITTANTAVTEEFNISSSIITAAAWAAGGNMTTPKQDGAGFGTQTAAIGAGGYTIPYTNNSQSYNGSTWTNTPTINTARTTRGSGTQTAGLIFGGNAPPADAKQTATESWNGSTWTSVNSLNTARGGIFSYGTQTASLAAGGSGTPTGTASATESWNGTSWTTVPGTLNTARGGGGSAGTQTSALAFGGDPSGAPPETSTATEAWNGSTWTSAPSLITARNGNRGFGLQTAALAFGGYNDGGTVVFSSSEQYDGTIWATGATMGTGRGNLQSAGVGSPTASSGIAFGGATTTPPYSALTEEFTGEILTNNVKTITTS